MKALLISVCLVLITLVCRGQGQAGKNPVPLQQGDSLMLKIDGNTAYYQNTVKVDTGIGVNLIYVRTLQFMAAKNFQQTYGFEEEGKEIFTTTQDLNTNVFTTGNYSDYIDVFTVQFAVTVDMKKQRYRFTVHNIVFFRPTETGNLRLSLYEMYLRETNGESRTIKKDSKKVMDAFEKYIGLLSAELTESINHRAAIYNTKF